MSEGQHETPLAWRGPLTRAPMTSRAARIVLVAGSILFTLLAVELGCRLMRGPASLLDWRNIVLAERVLVSERNLDNRFAFDPTLGYVQRGGFRSAQIHYDNEGFRHMPPLPADATAGPPVLATGDSYTQGDEVADDETWPAFLQQRLRRRTINAGVAAYGLDQTVLRTEQLATLLKPSLIVVGFIADDVRRSEMHRTWGAEKPYFELQGDRLALRNVPVPPSPDPRDTLSPWQSALGWSVALDTFLAFKGLRYEWVVDHARALPAGSGERLACPLMRRLARLEIPILVVAQYDFYVWENAEFAAEQRRISRVVLDCAERAGLASLDLYEPTEEAVRERGRNAVYRAWHPSPEGYRLIADGIARELERRHMSPR